MRERTPLAGRLGYLGGELLLALNQALDVGRVVAAALAGGDGALEGGVGDLGGDAGGGAQGAAAQAGGDGLAQGLGGCRLAQLLTQQQQVPGLFNLTGCDKYCVSTLTAMQQSQTRLQVWL